MFLFQASVLNRVTSESRYTETVLAPNRNLRWYFEGGEVEGVGMIAFDAATSGSVRDPPCRWRVRLPLLLIIALCIS